MANNETVTIDENSSPAAQKKKADPIAQVLKRNKDLEKRTQKSLGVNVILAFTVMASIGANVFLGTRPPPEPRYLIQQTDGSLLPVIPLNQPIANKGAVTQVVTDAVLKLHAIDFKNFRNQMSDASIYFTKNGWQKYLDEMTKSGTFDAIERRQLVLSSAINKPPVILKEYDISGYYAWDVEVEYSVNYFGAGYNSTSPLVARVTLVRIPTTEHPRGIAIAGFNVGRLSGSK